MERYTRPYVGFGDEYISYTVEDGEYGGIYKGTVLGEVVERLGYFEDLLEQGRLFIIGNQEYPCTDCKNEELLFSNGKICEIGGYPIRICEKNCKKYESYTRQVLSRME